MMTSHMGPPRKLERADTRRATPASTASVRHGGADRLPSAPPVREAPPEVPPREAPRLQEFRASPCSGGARTPAPAKPKAGRSSRSKYGTPAPVAAEGRASARRRRRRCRAMSMSTRGQAPVEQHRQPLHQGDFVGGEARGGERARRRRGRRRAAAGARQRRRDARPLDGGSGGGGRRRRRLGDPRRRLLARGRAPTPTLPRKCRSASTRAARPGSRAPRRPSYDENKI